MRNRRREEASGLVRASASCSDDVTTLQQLLRDDPHLLDRVSFACLNRTPLHTAALQGNLAIVKEVLRRNPQLAQELDSQRSSPLHIAAAQGYIDIASQLPSAASSMCWSRDCLGMYPVHIAVMKELLRQDSFPAMERLRRGDDSASLRETSSAYSIGSFDAVMASTHPNIFKHFVCANTTAFVSALITIFLITTRQPSGHIFFLLVAVYATGIHCGELRSFDNGNYSQYGNSHLSLLSSQRWLYPYASWDSF